MTQQALADAAGCLPSEDSRIVKALLDRMILKYETMQMVGKLSN